MFGLTSEEFQFLQNNLITPLKKASAKVYIFGSRAKGKHHPFSDIDICFETDQNKIVPPELISSINTFFEESHFPYKIDLSNYSELAKSYLPSVDSSKIEV